MACPKAELIGLDHGEHLGGELEKAQEIGDRGAVFAGALRHLLLGEAEFAGEALVGAGLLDRIEILALEVLDDGDLHRLLVGDLADDGRDGGFSGALRGEPAALAGDELVASGMLADGDGLNDAGDLDGVGEFVEGDIVEMGSGLVRIAVDQFDGKVADDFAGGLLGEAWRLRERPPGCRGRRAEGFRGRVRGLFVCRGLGSLRYLAGRLFEWLTGLRCLMRIMTSSASLR